MTRQDDRDSLPTLPSDATIDVTLTVDARGLRCPLPLLRAKQGLKQVSAGARVRVLATDAGSVRDFHSFATMSNTPLCHYSEQDGVFTYILEKP